MEIIRNYSNPQKSRQQRQWIEAIRSMDDDVYRAGACQKGKSRYVPPVSAELLALFLRIAIGIIEGNAEGAGGS